jgi:hypothetical protein
VTVSRRVLNGTYSSRATSEVRGCREPGMRVAADFGLEAKVLNAGIIDVGRAGSTGRLSVEIERR